MVALQLEVSVRIRHCQAAVGMPNVIATAQTECHSEHHSNSDQQFVLQHSICENVLAVPPQYSSVAIPISGAGCCHGQCL